LILLSPASSLLAERAQLLPRLSFVPNKPPAGAASFSPDVADPYRASIGRK
jgi:hypothetical protein